MSVEKRRKENCFGVFNVNVCRFFNKRRNAMKKRMVQFSVVGMVLFVSITTAYATFSNTSAGFLEDWEHLNVGDSPVLDGWGKDYDPVVESGNIGGSGSKIVNIDDESVANIRRSDMKVLPDANGDVTVEFDYKFDWKQDNYNFNIMYGQGGLNGRDVLDPRVNYWIWVSTTYSDRHLRNYTGSGWEVLLALDEDTNYHFVDVIHTGTGLHDLTVYKNGTKEAEYTGLATDTSSASWSSTSPLNTIEFYKGSDSYSADTWVDNISVVPEPATLGLLILGMFGLIRRK